jgi:multiple sugar transport system substrate-binding protein
MFKGKLRQGLLISLAALMVIPMASCSSSGGKTASSSASKSTSGAELKAESGASVKFAYSSGSPGEDAAWDMMLKGFTQDHPEIKLVEQKYTSTNFYSQLDTRVAGNDWPDVVRYTYQRLGKFKESNSMLDLTNKYSAASLDDLVPAYRAAMTYKNKLVGMPQQTDTIAVIYNKEMFTKSNIRIPKSATDGWSWSEITTIAKKLKTDNNLKYAFGGIWENTSGYRFLPFVYMNGGSLLNAAGTGISVKSPQVLGAIKLYDGWVKDGLINPNGFTQPAQANNLFVAKKLAFVFSGSWNMSFMEKNMPGNWGVTYMPQVNGKTSSDLGGNAVFAYSGTKYPNASAIFIDYLTNKAGMRKFCENGDFIPVRKSLLSEGMSYPTFQNEMGIFMNIANTVDQKQAKDETSVRFQQFNTILNKNMDPLIINRSKTPDQVVADMETQMKAALAE